MQVRQVSSFFNDMYGLFIRPFRELLYTLFQLFKDKNAERQNLNLSLIEQVFEAWEKIKMENSEGERELLFLIKKYGKRKILKILKQIQGFQSVNPQKLEFLKGKTLEEQILMLEKMKKCSKSIKDSVHRWILTEEKKEQQEKLLRQEREKHTTESLIKKIELLIKQGDKYNATKYFNRLMKYSHKMTFEEIEHVKILHSQIKALVEEHVRYKETQPPVDTSIEKQEQQIEATKKSKSTYSDEVAQYIQKLRLYVADKDFKKAQKLSDYILETFQLTERETEILEKIITKLRYEQEEDSKISFEKDMENASDHIATLETDIKEKNVLIAKILAYYYLKDPDLIPAPADNRIGNYIQEERSENYDASLLSNITEVILKNLRLCIEPFITMQ